jgi:hypothetical protein
MIHVNRCDRSAAPLQQNRIKRVTEVQAKEVKRIATVSFFRDRHARVVDVKLHSAPIVPNAQANCGVVYYVMCQQRLVSRPQESDFADAGPSICIRRTLAAWNAPNPLNPVTTVFIELPSAGEVTVRVYDVRGRLVGTLLHDHAHEENGAFEVGTVSRDYNESRRTDRSTGSPNHLNLDVCCNPVLHPRIAGRVG